MKQKSKGVFALLVVVALVLLVGASCSTSTDTNTNTVTENTNTAAALGLWAIATSQGDIAGTDIAGTLNGNDFDVQSVQITVWDDEYDWNFSNTASDEECDLIMGEDAVNFSSKDMQVGTFEKAMTDEVEFDDYHAYYYYEQADGVPMSVNTDWAAKIVVTEIDETNNTVSGFANIEFSDGLTLIDGAFEAELCE